MSSPTCIPLNEEIIPIRIPLFMRACVRVCVRACVRAHKRTQGGWMVGGCRGDILIPTSTTPSPIPKGSARAQRACRGFRFLYVQAVVITKHTLTCKRE